MYMCSLSSVASFLHVQLALVAMVAPFRLEAGHSSSPTTCTLWIWHASGDAASIWDIADKGCGRPSKFKSVPCEDAHSSF